MEKKQPISADFEVLLQIYEDTAINNGYATVLDLVKETGLDKVQVEKSIFRMYDRMMIDVDNKKIDVNTVAACYTISDSFMGFTKGLYNATEKVDAKNNELQPKSSKKNLIQDAAVEDINQPQLSLKRKSK